MNLSQYYSDEKCDAMQTDTEDGLLIRPSANVKVAMKFITEKREYNKQYASLYWFRLEKQKKSLQNNLTKWANSI